ncbi:XRE family transcriptional regulator [Cupriavidus pauculus]|uniref:XRE family transcriptional regulator n=1 Tax=Cupriavidus pauculus TaxID=82633 RepID=UPI001D0C2E65|nr:LexA family transcriptional regulator [Cupriavidus pauculus]
MPHRNVGQRVKERRKELGYSQKELAEKCNLTQPTISSLERGDSKTSGNLATIAHHLKVSALWLETGRGDKDIAQVKQIRRVGGNGTVEKEYEIRVLPSEGSCGGSPDGPDGTKLESPIIKRSQFFTEYGVKPENVVAVVADGHGNAPEIKHRDIVLFDTENTLSMASGEVYALRTPMGTRIKRVVFRSDGQLTLSNLNRENGAYADEVYATPADAKVEPLGRYFYREGGQRRR